MTVESTSTYAGPYPTNGVATAFPFSFRALTADEVSVVLEVAGVRTTVQSSLYQVTLGAQNGTVVFYVPPAAGNNLYVESDPSFQQDISFSNQAAFLPDSHNEANDRSAVRDQVLLNGVGRALTVPIGELAPDLPPAALRTGGNKILAPDPVTGAISVLDGSAFKGDPGSPGEGYPSKVALANALVGATDFDDFYYSGLGAGKFIFRTGNQSALVAADNAAGGLRGIVVAPTSDPTGGSGAAIRQFDGLLDPEFFGASTSIADNYASFLAVDTFAAQLGMAVSAGPGTYNILSDILLAADWVNDPKSIIRFSGPNVTGGRRLIRRRSYAGVPTRTVRLGSTAVRLRAALADQAAFLRYVNCSTPADASQFPKGAIVRISFGYDPYDADGCLFRYDRLNRVMSSNPSTGLIELETAIDVPVKGWGFEPTGPYYNPSDWAAGQAIAIGNTRYHPYLVANAPAGSNSNIGGVFQATTAGTTAGSSLLTDTGVSWARVTNDYNGPDNAAVAGSGRGTVQIDGRPVIEMVANPVYDVGWTGGTVVWAGDFSCNMAFDLRSVYNCFVENVVIKSETQPIANRFAVTEASSRCKLLSVTDATTASPTTPSQDRTVECYAADVELSAYKCDQGWNGSATPLIYCENFGRVTIGNNSVFSHRGLTNNSWCCAVNGGGEVSARASEFVGFASPFRESLSFATPIDLDWFHTGRYTILADNRIQISEKQVRLFAGGTTRLDAYVGNQLFFFDMDLDHINGRMFQPHALVPIEFSFAPVANAGDTIVEYTDAGNSQAPFQGRASLVLMGVEVSWEGPPAGGSVGVRARRFNGVQRSMFSATDASNIITVTSAAPFNSRYAGDGTTGRMVDHRVSGERLRMSYTSNASAAGGTVRVRAWVLVEGGKSGSA